MLHHFVATCLTRSAPNATLNFLKKKIFQFGQLKYNTIHAFVGNDESSE